jgi:hypothetical protein
MTADHSNNILNGSVQFVNRAILLNRDTGKAKVFGPRIGLPDRIT